MTIVKICYIRWINIRTGEEKNNEASYWRKGAILMGLAAIIFMTVFALVRRWHMEPGRDHLPIAKMTVGAQAPLIRITKMDDRLDVESGEYDVIITLERDKTDTAATQTLHITCLDEGHRVLWKDELTTALIAKGDSGRLISKQKVEKNDPHPAEIIASTTAR